MTDATHFIEVSKIPASYHLIDFPDMYVSSRPYPIDMLKDRLAHTKLWRQETLFIWKIKLK